MMIIEGIKFIIIVVTMQYTTLNYYFLMEAGVKYLWYQ